MSGRQPLPPQQPPKPARPNFRQQQGKRKRPTDDDDGNNPNSIPNANGAPLFNARATTSGGKRRLPKAKKQKTDGPKKEPGQPTPPLTEAEKKEKKKQQRKSRKEKNAVDESDLDYALGLNRAIGRMDPEAAAAYLARQTKRYGSDLSEVELADLSIDAAAFQDTSAAYDKDRTLDNLSDFLETVVAGGRQTMQASSKTNGSPHTIVVTGAGMRAADLVRAVRPFQTKTNMVSKLFAKHIKLAEAVSNLQSHRTGIAVGTPARLIDLLDNSALSVAQLQRIVVDVSHIDQKKRGVLDMQDTALPVAKWLARPEFKARYGRARKGEGEASKPLSIVFY
ncbi:hypothetical protein F503_03513 [Ophiostoma piceae UAMH 11346]|uniref:Replication regulator protein n=1 Tax=Ophiostoma piceae (strain UAMH 11346) TaxID=1262450 RepID=S3BY92_OPHP1|nr:hypothetical protein F503_03513 [Ophiostoma piceae UAMH 11346]